MCMDSPQHVHMLLRAITDMLKEYSAYQVNDITCVHDKRPIEANITLSMWVVL